MADNSAVRTAVIGGVFSLVGTVVAALVTGMFGLWGSASPSIPPAPPPSITPLADSASTPDIRPAPLMPAYTLNFQAFQQATRPLDLPEARRAAIVGQVQGRQIVWKGVVGEVVPQDNPQPDSAYCLVLHEDETSRHQVLGSASAKCFFPASAREQIESLQPGDEVTITGTFEQHWGALGSRVVNCSVLRR